MGRVTEPLAQAVVQPVLGVVEAGRDLEAELDEPRTTDRNEQGLVADRAFDEVAKPCFDEIATREREQISGHAPQGTCGVD